MTQLYDSIASLLSTRQIATNKIAVGKFKAPTLADEKIVIPEADNTVLQVLGIPLLWDWHIAPTGQIDKDMYDFCDKIPGDTVGNYFSPGNDSFTNNYSSFLQLLNTDTFLLKGLLPTIKGANETPAISINASPVPNGWTKVLNEAGVLEWKRIWNTSDTPYSWRSKIGLGNTNKDLELVFDTGNINLKDSSGDDVNIPKSANIQMKITSKAWGLITITPGSWFNGSLFHFANTADAYVTGVSPDMIFGNGQLLPARISSFLVASMPSATVVLNNSYIPDSISELQLSGFKFSSNPPVSDDKTNLNVDFKVNDLNNGLSEISTEPVAAGTDTNNAYILAVTLQLINT